MKPASFVLLFLVLVNTSCNRTPRNHSIGVAFESLQSEGWVVGFETIKRELAAHNLRAVEAIANSDANRQYEQINTFINRRVDGIIIAPVDAQTVVPMIEAAN